MPQCRLFPSSQSFLVRLFLISVAASVVDISTPVPVDEHNEIVEITLLEEAWNSDHRSRRDADSNLPDRLTFAIPVEGDQALIRMTRSRLLPVIMSDEESTLDANSFSEDAAVYTDLASSSAMIVKRDSGNYMLRGTFVHQDVAWTLHHETRHKRDADNIASMPHLISPYLAAKRSFVGDTVEYSPELRARRGALETSTSRMGPLVPEKNATRKRPTQHVVEIAFIVDNADYNKWVKFVGLDNTTREMRLWYTYVAESINIRYQNIKDPDIAIRTTVTVLRILSNAKDGTLFSNQTTDGVLNGENGLGTFMTWYTSQSDIPRSDHYMLFTGLKLKSDKDEKLHGIPMNKKLCNQLSVSICQNGFSEITGYTAAHVLGHSMSAEHDGRKGNNCSANDLYIMSSEDTFPVRSNKAGNNWQFSPCSIDAFKSYLASESCTRETSTVKPDLTAPPPGQRAGEVLSPDEQCKLAFQNRSSHFCEHYIDSIEDLCRRMQCSVPGSQECRFTRPQEYTSCGVNKWCRSGRCVVNDELTTTTSKTISTAPTAPTTVVRPSSTTTATTVVRPSATSAGAAATSHLPGSSSSHKANNVTTTTFKPTTKPPARSCLSTLPSSATTVVSVTFGLCLFFCSAV